MTDRPPRPHRHTEEEFQQNGELLDLSKQILTLTQEVHAAAQRNGRLVTPPSKTTAT